MFRPRVIPVLLLKSGGLVKTVGFDSSRYIGDPINAVRLFNDFEADELVLLDITATNEKRVINTDIVKEIADEAFMPFAVGGGITSCDQALELISAGAEKVIINSAFIENPQLVKQLAALAGNQSVVVSIDVKKNWLGNYTAYSHSGKKKASLSPLHLAKLAEEMGAGEIMVNSITNDGRMQGYDLELIQQISTAVNIPVVVCGGAGKLAHLKAGTEAGAHAVGAGSLFIYHGQRNAVLINYPEKSQLISVFSTTKNEG